ncbi:alpha-L-rhamnosidase C-terminal domain-containing protein [Oleiagrimonas sp. C23AA]|uniref:alpha-L-rhamnosidase C-terminal domain-containing protein n=1 Tax=Oleiagrimonas sp. C23AA TaxID=2719047 RepID=UPI001F0D6919|nr:alpha-L-rhamnosidase C-terminal domain-containing protein [Oleiagrimonas sp. C23AA]
MRSMSCCVLGWWAAWPALAAAPSPPSWQPYVVAPSSRHVRPVRVLSVSGDVTHADALLDGHGVAVFKRPPPQAESRWPQGTRIQLPGLKDARGAEHLIDGALASVWQAPARIAGSTPAIDLDTPTAQTLHGMTVRAASGHVLADFSVDARQDGAWKRVASVHGNKQLQVAVTFPRAVTARRWRIDVPVAKNADSARIKLAEIWPGALHDAPPPSVVLDFGKVVVGYPRLHFAAGSTPGTGLRLAFSETRQYLGERSDFTRSDNGDAIVPGTDQVVATTQPRVWVDRHGCTHERKVCDDGLHGFRYLRISLDALPADAPYAKPSGVVRLRDVSLDFTAYLGRPDTYAGWFESSDKALNRYWFDASYTNELITDTFRADDVEPRQANSAFLDGKRVLHDGAKRDRDPYVGDVAVSARTAYLTHGAALGDAARNVLLDLAKHQRVDGWIAPASIRHYTLPLFEYPLWWVVADWDNLRYTGDLAFTRAIYPHLLRLLDGWYPKVADAHGLLHKGLDGTSGYGDYAFLPRTGEVSYYNALYVLALHDAVAMAHALGHDNDATRWTARARHVARAMNARLWDAKAGAYLDSRQGPVRHAQDGNGLAVVAGVASRSRARQALGYLGTHTALPYGHAFMDNNTLLPDGGKRVYAFTSYPEIQARFQVGMTASALREIHALYGWMAHHDPGTTDWEGIGAGGSMYEGGYTSAAHGWSTGVVPLLSNDVLGVTPTGPGFARWTLHPHPGDLKWARGKVPTPHGPIAVHWVQKNARLELGVTVPKGTVARVVLPAAKGSHVVMDGHTAEARWRGHAAGDRGAWVLDRVVPGKHRFRVTAR